LAEKYILHRIVHVAFVELSHVIIFGASYS
jgi:hypothetical protein